MPAVPRCMFELRSKGCRRRAARRVPRIPPLPHGKNALMRKIESTKSTKPWLLLGFLACLWLLPLKSANSQSVSNEVPLALSSDRACNPSVESRGMSTWLERDQAPRGVLTELYRRADANKEEPDKAGGQVSIFSLGTGARRKSRPSPLGSRPAFTRPSGEAARRWRMRESPFRCAAPESC
jgi:hypothetical protein